MANAEQLQKLAEVSEWVGNGTINALGKQFGGKDTHLASLVIPLNGVLLSSGAIFRAAKENPNPDLPQSELEKMDRGELIDSETFTKVLTPALHAAARPDQSLLLSSVGRKSGEEFGVIEATGLAGHTMVAAVVFDITRVESHRRLGVSEDRGRDDDKPEELDTRLDFYEEFTLPVIKTYENKGLLIVVDAMPEQDIVFNTLVHALHDRATGKG